MTAVELIVVPYDSGARGARMGAGPEHLLDLGLPAALARPGRAVHVQTVELAPRRPMSEARAAVELAASIAGRVREARSVGGLPIVLSGNCISSLGTVAALGAAETAVLWLDAHGDLNTPETTTSGFVDGMALATLLGWCWRGLAGTVDGFAPVPEERVILLGARDLDPPEAERLAASGLAHVTADAVRARGATEAIRPALDALDATVRRLYVHVDLDVLDPSVGHANGFAAPGGLGLDDVVDTIILASARAPIAAAALTAYDPAADADGRAASAALEIAAALAGAGPGAPTPRR